MEGTHLGTLRTLELCEPQWSVPQGCPLVPAGWQDSDAPLAPPQQGTADNKEVILVIQTCLLLLQQAES